jgi:hypothetical protein
MLWALTNERQIIPIDDLRVHENRIECWCKPVFEEYDKCYKHNSLDNREKYESGELRLH